MDPIKNGGITDWLADALERAGDDSRARSEAIATFVGASLAVRHQERSLSGTVALILAG